MLISHHSSRVPPEKKTQVDRDDALPASAHRETRAFRRSAEAAHAGASRLLTVFYGYSCGRTASHRDPHVGAHRLHRYLRLLIFPCRCCSGRTRSSGSTCGLELTKTVKPSASRPNITSTRRDVSGSSSPAGRLDASRRV